MSSPGAAKLLTVLAVGLWCGLAMMLVHELGHVLAAWATGGVVTSVELRSGRLSHTLVRPNPHPSLVLWGGFVFGWLAPQLVAAVWRDDRGAVGPALRAWAAFCLLAGGAYLALGATERLTDTGQLVAAGWPLPALIVIGAGVAAAGYARSRRPWAELFARLDRAANPWRLAAYWWAWLVAWCVGQGVLNEALQP